MKYSIDIELLVICKSIISENKTLNEWVEVESSDMFQSGKYSGGFDATEMEFCFSLYSKSGEYWFQLSLDEVYGIYDGRIKEIELNESS